MTDVLDELRAAFARYSWGHYDPFSVLDAFAAEHPGLVDTGTAFPCPASLGVCCLCGSPIRECMATIQEDWPDDPTPPLKGDWTCPACAKEAGGER